MEQQGRGTEVVVPSMYVNGVKRRCYRITIMVDLDVNEQKLKDECVEDKTVCVAYQREICPSTDKEHIQACIYYKNPRSWNSIKKLFAPNCVLVGDFPQEAIKYCNKVESRKVGCEPFLWGHPPNQGKRTDLMAIAKEIETGKTVDSLALENPMLYHQYGRTLTKLEDLRLRKQCRTQMTAGIWYYGDTGVGKSHRAFSSAPMEDIYNLNTQDNGWWEGYSQQRVVVIQELRGEIKYSQLLSLVDKWPHSVKRRNREPMPFTSELVVITSSLPPEEVYYNLASTDSLNQLYRRFKVYKVINETTIIEHVWNGTEVPIGNITTMG